jgi:hypothetical protein
MQQNHCWLGIGEVHLLSGSWRWADSTGSTLANLGDTPLGSPIILLCSERADHTLRFLGGLRSWGEDDPRPWSPRPEFVQDGRQCPPAFFVI